MTASATRPWTALECEREALKAIRSARLARSAPDGNRNEVKAWVKRARWWWRCALEARRNCWCNGTGVMLAEYDQHTGYSVTVDCPDCTGTAEPNERKAPALVDGDTPAGHLRNAQQILVTAKHLEGFTLNGDILAAVGDRISSALKGIPE